MAKRNLEHRFTEPELDVLAAALEEYWSICHEAEREDEDNVQEHSSAEVDALMKKLNPERRKQ